MENPVQVVTLVTGSICFVLYLYLSVRPVPTKLATDTLIAAAGKHAETPAADGFVPTVDDMTKLLEAVSKLTDSLSKATPALTALIGAILLFAIAAASGFAPPDAPHAPSDAKTSAPANAAEGGAAGNVSKQKPQHEKGN